MLKVSDYISLMGHGLGSTPDSRLDLYETLNRAGRALVTLHDWQWRSQGPITVTGVASQDYIDLPANFGSLRKAYIDNRAGGSGFAGVRATNLDEVISLRQSLDYGSMTGHFLIAVNWVQPPAMDSAPYARLECWPRPTTTGQPAISLLYKANWANINSGDTDAVPSIPENFEQALILAARAYAGGLQEQRTMWEDGALGAEIARLKFEEGREQPDLGVMRGGAARWINDDDNDDKGRRYMGSVSL